MGQRLPDELFRKGTTEPRKPESRRRRARGSVPPERPMPLPKPDVGIALRWMVLLTVVVAVGSFFLGRLVLFAAESPAPSVSPSVIIPSEPDRFVYSGDVAVTDASQAYDECAEAEHAASTLVDYDATTFWRCGGPGEGQTVTFEFDQPVSLVGLRLINGNTVDDDRYLLERRITGIRWDFGDGSYFEQGLAASDREPQEVRFPPIMTETIAMTVRTVTEPGNQDDDSDMVSVSKLEFLVPADG